jgi:hypothetical protein
MTGCSAVSYRRKEWAYIPTTYNKEGWLNSRAKEKHKRSTEDKKHEIGKEKQPEQIVHEMCQVRRCGVLIPVGALGD